MSTQKSNLQTHYKTHNAVTPCHVYTEVVYLSLNFPSGRLIRSSSGEPQRTLHPSPRTQTPRPITQSVLSRFMFPPQSVPRAAPSSSPPAGVRVKSEATQTFAFTYTPKLV